MARLEGFDANFDDDYDSPTLPPDDFFWGKLVTDEGQQQARMQFLVAIQTYTPADGCFRPNAVIRGLHDVLPVYREALAGWLELNEDVPRWKTGIPWLDVRDSPIFSDLWAGVKVWARKYHLTFESHPAEWVLEHAHANLTLWAYPRREEADLQWAIYPDAYEDGSRRIRGEWLKVFYNPESTRAEDAHVELDRQIQVIHARAAEFGARSTSGLVKSRDGTRCWDDNGKPLKIPLYVEWFVRRQVCCESLDSIANELQGYKDTHNAIRSACRDFAKLIGLTPRRDKPGPKGKHSRLSK